MGIEAAGGEGDSTFCLCSDALTATLHCKNISHPKIGYNVENWIALRIRVVHPSYNCGERSEKSTTTLCKAIAKIIYNLKLHCFLTVWRAFWTPPLLAPRPTPWTTLAFWAAPSAGGIDNAGWSWLALALREPGERAPRVWGPRLRTSLPRPALPRAAQLWVLGTRDCRGRGSAPS